MSHKEQASQLFHKICDMGMDGASEEVSIASIEVALMQTRQDEREECAKVAIGNGVDCVCGETIAHAIRTRELENG